MDRSIYLWRDWADRRARLFPQLHRRSISNLLSYPMSSTAILPRSYGTTGSMSEIDRLRIENQRLSDEVKRLVTTESQLYEVQEHLDGQMSAYRQLYELGKKFNTTVDLTTILQFAVQFVLYELNFERCLFLMKPSGSNVFSIEAMDGYYDDAEHTSIARLALPTASLALAPLYAGLERVLCLPDCRRSELTSLRRLIGMDEYVVLPFGGEPKNPIRLLVAGNTAGRAPYQRRVVQEGEALLGLANLVTPRSTTRASTKRSNGSGSLSKRKSANVRGRSRARWKNCAPRRIG